MPCMNSTSALNGGLGWIRTVSSVSCLPGWPGAPGCTIGADCGADAATALSKNSEAVRDRLQRAMRYYTIRVLGQSNPVPLSGAANLGCSRLSRRLSRATGAVLTLDVRSF